MSSPPAAVSTRKRPERPSSGPIRVSEPRIWLKRRASGALVLTLRAQRVTEASRWPTSTPMPSRMRSIVRTSPMSGRLCRVIGSSERRQAASMGSAAFLLPTGRMLPTSGWPPSMTNLVMAILVDLAACCRSAPRLLFPHSTLWLGGLFRLAAAAAHEHTFQNAPAEILFPLFTWYNNQVSSQVRNCAGEG